MAGNNNSALIAELVSALQTNLAPYAPTRLNVAPPTLRNASAIDNLLGTNINRSRQSILDELLANINAAYAASMDEQNNNERAYIQALANVSDTALDTMRNQYAGDTAVGANRGMQAANALSAILGMQGNSIEGVNDLFGNRSTLLNQKATDTANAATEATNLYATLQQYLADYAKSLYETDSTNHTTELASWNAYIDALMSAIPQLEYYNSLSNGGNGYYSDGGGYTGDGYTYAPTVGVSTGTTGGNTGTVSTAYNPYLSRTALSGIATPETLHPTTASILNSVLYGTPTIPTDYDDDDDVIHGGGGRRGRGSLTRSAVTMPEAPSAESSDGVVFPKAKQRVKTAYPSVTNRTNLASRVPSSGTGTAKYPVPTYTAGASTALRTGPVNTLPVNTYNSVNLASKVPTTTQTNTNALNSVVKKSNNNSTPSKANTVTNALNNALNSVKKTTNNTIAQSKANTNPNSSVKKAVSKPSTKSGANTAVALSGGLSSVKKTTNNTNAKKKTVVSKSKR